MTLDRYDHRGPWGRVPGEPGDHPNVGGTERVLSVLAGGALAVLGLSRRSLGGALLALTGGYLVYRGASGHCLAYRALGVSTAPSPFAVSQEQGIHVDESIIINVAPETLYRFWRRLDNLPRFLSHLKEVRVLDDRRSHWVVDGPAGSEVTWDAEVVGDIENQMISWRSLEGARVPNAGAVRFRAMPEDESTVMRVSLRYNPPLGAAGAALARLFGDNPARQIREDLWQLKELMEHGRLPADSTTETPREHAEKLVTEASEESFPASDAPSYSPGSIGGRHPNERRS